jgi:hypothetical protein
MKMTNRQIAIAAFAAYNQAMHVWIWIDDEKSPRPNAADFGIVHGWCAGFNQVALGASDNNAQPYLD